MSNIGIFVQNPLSSIKQCINWLFENTANFGYSFVVAICHYAIQILNDLSARPEQTVDDSSLHKTNRLILPLGSMLVMAMGKSVPGMRKIMFHDQR